MGSLTWSTREPARRCRFLYVSAMLSTNVPFARQDAFHWLPRIAALAVRFMESFVAILLWELGVAWPNN